MPRFVNKHGVDAAGQPTLERMPINAAIAETADAFTPSIMLGTLVELLHAQGVLNDEAIIRMLTTKHELLPATAAEVVS